MRDVEKLGRQDVCAPGAWRVFVAIELPAEVRHRVAQHIQLLREQVPDTRASWNREQNLHLTLKFLGDIPVTRVEAASRAVEQAAKGVDSFALTIEGSGSFPPHGTPRVLWLGIQGAANESSALFDVLEEEFVNQGFPREHRPFHPHLTIARLRKPHGARRLAELHKQIGFERMAFQVKDVCVIRSELSPEGSRYTVIARHALLTT